MTKQFLRLLLLTMTVLAVAGVCNAQSNLLRNANADLKSESWRTHGEASVEECAAQNPCFVVRNGGYFLQDVGLPDGAVGQYALLIGRGASERINTDGAITGLPYLYGYMNAADDHILSYLQGQNLLASASLENEWVTMSGVFRVPEGTKYVRFFLNQALRKGVPHNGSAARFDDVGLYLFATEQDARMFAKDRH